MKYKESIGSKVFDIFNYLLMIFLMIIMIYPLLNIIAVSLSLPDYVSLGRVTFYPKGFNLEGYKYILKDPEILTAYKNTIIYAGVGTFFTLLFTSMMAYPLSIKEFRAKKFLTIYLAITMFIGGGLIPYYLLIKKLHMMDTLWVMVIPGCVSAYNAIIFRSFFQNIPNELRESALMDGANDVIILFKIILPLSKPLLATFGLFAIVGHWNDWFNALIFLSDEKRHPIQMILRKILFDIDQTKVDATKAQMLISKKADPQNIRMATVVVTMIPMLCVYPFLQKYFVKGMMVGSIKG